MSSVSIRVIGADGFVVVEIEEQDYDSSIVADILRANNDTLRIPDAQLDAGFITKIYGIEAIWGATGDQWWWMLKINDELSSAGITTARVGDGDIITFTLTEGFGE